MRIIFRTLSLAALPLWAGTAVAAVDIAGVKVDEALSVAGTRLQLNGAGVRYKGPFKVYVGDLYATRPVKSLDELIAAPGPKRLGMTFLREINSAEFGKMLTRGIEDNVAKGDLAPLVPALVRMGELFNEHKSLASGSKVLIDSVPGTGTVVTINGVQAGEPFKEPTLFRAILSIWLGPVPVDFRLKDTLLGVR